MKFLRSSGVSSMKEAPSILFFRKIFTTFLSNPRLERSWHTTGVGTLSIVCRTPLLLLFEMKDPKRSCQIPQLQYDRKSARATTNFRFEHARTSDHTHTYVLTFVHCTYINFLLWRSQRPFVCTQCVGFQAPTFQLLLCHAVRVHSGNFRVTCCMREYSYRKHCQRHHQQQTRLGADVGGDSNPPDDGTAVPDTPLGEEYPREFSGQIRE